MFASYADALAATLPQPITVPIFDREGRESAYHQGVALRHTDGRIGPPMSVVGARFTPPDVRRLGAALDEATADLGGIARLGPARAQITPRGALSLVVGRGSGEPGALLAPRLSADPSDRALYVRFRSALDGSEAESLDVLTVRILCSNGAVGWGSLGGFARRHTAKLDDDRARWAVGARAALPREIERQARVLAFLRSVDVAHSALNETIARIVGGVSADEIDGRGPLPVLTPGQTARRDRIVEMVETADGHYVPESTHPGRVDALQVLEAATAYDRHYARGDLDKRRDRVMAGRGVGTRALQWGIRLAGEGGVL